MYLLTRRTSAGAAAAAYGTTVGKLSKFLAVFNGTPRLKRVFVRETVKVADCLKTNSMYFENKGEKFAIVIWNKIVETS